MKRIAILLLTLIMLFNSQALAVCAAEVELELRVNGEKQSYALTSVASSAGNRMLAPASPFAKAIGAECTVDNNNITITKGDTSIVFTTGSSTAAVNGSGTALDTPAQLIGEVAYLPVEFCGRELGYHVLGTRNGNSLRIVSKTSTTAPALEQKEGMAALVSEVERPVPTEFERTNALDDLIFQREDWTGAVETIDPSEIGPLPTGPVIFSPQDFMDELVGLSHIQYSFSTVDVTERYEGNFMSMSVKMAGQSIGEANNNANPLPFTEAVRINSKFDISNAFAAKIEFTKKLPSPAKSDKYVLSYYARLIEGGDPDFGLGKISFTVYGENGSTLEQVVEISPEWKRYDFLLTDKAGADRIRFIGAHEKQIIEIGGFEIRNVGEDADTSYFTKTKDDLLPQDLAPDAPWRAEALERIEKVRKGDFKVVVKDSSGNPVPNAEVKFDMFEHEFKFGVTMDVEYVDDKLLEGYTFLDSDGNKLELTDENGKDASVFNGNKDEQLLERVGLNFNSVSVGNRLKWGVYAEDKENNPKLTSTARIVMNVAKEQGIKYFRGHALWMPDVDGTMAKPAEMYALLSGTSDDKETRYESLKNDFIAPHFEEMDTDFSEIYEWDVTNETHGRFSFTNAFGMRIFNDIYSIAAEKLTNGQELMLCDNRQFEEQYWERLDWFKEQGIKYDSLGMQGHSRIGSYDYNNNYRPTKWLEVWDRFAYEYGKTFAVTEFSVGALKDEYGWEGQADYMRDILIAAYSHPACTGVNLWWLADYWSEWNSPFRPDNADYGKIGAGVSPLYSLYFEDKPGIEVYQDLLYNKWWTRGAKATTDANGEGTVRGFYGDYKVTVTVNGKEETVKAAFHKGYENVLEITLQ